MQPAGRAVLLHNGRPKSRQDVQAAVDIDVGVRDLQQCAPTRSRGRGRNGCSRQCRRPDCFHDTGSAEPIAFARWAAGERPKGSGRTPHVVAGRQSRRQLCKRPALLDVAFTCAGNWSLPSPLQWVPVADLRAGDVFIKGGFRPRRLVVDLVENPTQERRFLLLQSFLPAQRCTFSIRRAVTVSPGMPGSASSLSPQSGALTRQLSRWGFLLRRDGLRSVPRQPAGRYGTCRQQLQASRDDSGQRRADSADGRRSLPAVRSDWELPSIGLRACHAWQGRARHRSACANKGCLGVSKRSADGANPQSGPKYMTCRCAPPWASRRQDCG